MGTPKISTFLIAMVWVAFFAAVSAPFIANLGANYGNNFDTTNMNATFNKLNELNKDVITYKDSAMDYKEKTGIVDLVGDMFNQGYQTIKVMGQSLDIFQSMLFGAFNNSVFNIPAMGNLKTAILLTVIILIVIGVILKAVIKSDI